MKHTVKVSGFAALLLVLFISNISKADIDVNIYYSDIHKSEIVEIIDTCGQQHVLKIDKNDLFKRDKINRWFKQLQDFNILQDCVPK